MASLQRHRGLLDVLLVERVANCADLTQSQHTLTLAATPYTGAFWVYEDSNFIDHDRTLHAQAEVPLAFK